MKDEKSRKICRTILPAFARMAVVGAFACYGQSALAIAVNSAKDVDLDSLPYITPQTPHIARNDGQCTLVEAVELANWKTSGGSPTTQPTFDCGTAQSGKNTITFKSQYEITLAGRLFSQSAFEISSKIEIRGPVIIDAAKKTRAFRLGSASSALLMKDVTIRNGRVDGGGAGVLVTSPDALLLIDSCTFQWNEAVNGDGGAISSAALATRDAKGNQVSGLVINESTFDRNSARRGGAYFGAPMFLSFSDITNNSATHAGGGLYITGGSNRRQDIHGAVLNGNYVYHPYEGVTDGGAYGGAIFSDSSVAMTYSELSSNFVNADVTERKDALGNVRPYDVVDVSGGAFYLGSGAGTDTMLLASTFVRNRAGAYNGGGGAIRVDRPALLSGLGIQDNAGVVGSAVYVHASSGSDSDAVSIVNSSIIDNGLPDVFFGGGAPPFEYLGVTGSVVSRGAVPVDIRNSFVFQNTVVGTSLIAEVGSKASMQLRNTAVGAQQDTLNNVCLGDIKDEGGNLQTIDPLNEMAPSPVTCPASIPIAINSSAFVTPAKITSAAAIGRGGKMLAYYVANPGAGAYAQMRGQGIPVVCSEPPVGGYSQTEQFRVTCDIGPLVLN